MELEENSVPVERRRHWSRRIDVLVGFTGGLAVWLVVLGVYLVLPIGGETNSTADGDADAMANFETAAGGPGMLSGEVEAQPLDNRVSGLFAGHFQVGMSAPELVSTTLEQGYIENSVWPAQLQSLIDRGPADGSVNFFGADAQGVASYVLELCNGIVSRITERRTFADASGLTKQQEGDGLGSLGDLTLVTEGQAPDVVLSRSYQHIYDSGRTARINVRYEHGEDPRRVFSVSDTERCRRQMVSR